MMRWLLPCALLLTSACSGCGTRPDATTPYLAAEPLDEVSGMAASPGHPGVFWVHNDSGDAARLFAVDEMGALLGTWRVAGAHNVDWEAIAHDRDGHLWIADIGNNANKRRDLTLYRVPEPDPGLGGGTVQVDRLVRVRYPDQAAFPPPKANKRFDAEALFWAPSVELGRPTLYVLTKHRNDDLSTTLYRVDDLSDGAEVTLTRISSARIGGDPDNYGGMVTGAAATDDGQLLAMLSYHAVFVFRRSPTSDDYVQSLVARVDLDQAITQQVESIAWVGDDLLFASEQRRVFRLPNPVLAPPTRFP